MHIKYLLDLLRNYKTTQIHIIAYHIVRMLIFPINAFFKTSQFNEVQRILSLGCGYGTLETILAIQYPNINITGCDLSKDRISTAQKATRSLRNLTFIQKDVHNINLDSFNAIICNDVLHHLDTLVQRTLLEKMSSSHIKRIIIKDVDLLPRWKYLWNYFHDLIIAGQPLTYKSSDFFKNYLENVGFQVVINRVDMWFPYNHYIIQATKD